MKSFTITYQCWDKDDDYDTLVYDIAPGDGVQQDDELMRIYDNLSRNYVDIEETNREYGE